MDPQCPTCEMFDMINSRHIGGNKYVVYCHNCGHIIGLV